MNCPCDLKNFANSQLSASNFKSFSRSLEQFFLTLDLNNFGNKLPFIDPFEFYVLDLFKMKKASQFLAKFLKFWP